MKTVSVTEFRSNMKRYLEIAETEKIVIHRNNGVSFVLMPLEEENDDCLLSDQQKKAIDKGLESIAQGEVHSHQDVIEETKQRFSHLFNR